QPPEVLLLPVSQAHQARHRFTARCGLFPLPALLLWRLNTECECIQVKPVILVQLSKLDSFGPAAFQRGARSLKFPNCILQSCCRFRSYGAIWIVEHVADPKFLQAF